MRSQLEDRCIVCGAEPGSPCTTLSEHGCCDPDKRLRDLKPGDERPVPHFYR